MSGNIRIDTDSLVNNRSYYAIVEDHPLDANGNIITWINRGESASVFADQALYTSGYDERYRINYNDSAHDTFYIFRIDGQMAPSSSILAANDITINAGTVLNDAGLIAAGRDVSITAATVTNKARNVSDWGYVASWRDAHPGWYGSLYVSDFNPSKFTAYNLLSIVAPSSIIAGRNLNASVTNLNNATSNSGASAPNITAIGSNIAANSTNPNVTPLTLVDDGSLSYSNSAALDTSLFANIPTGSNGLFIVNNAPGANYLIETNVAFINMNRFLGSNYFLTRIGYAQPYKLLADPFYETRLIEQAIFERTGQRYLNAGIGTDLDQMQALMDNAVIEMASLNLTVGMELTYAQIAALNSDIMWLVEDEINGQRVLKPVVYLAQATIDALNGEGAKIMAGNNVILTASNTLDNSGLILAGNDLSASVTNNITNYGKIKAGRDITLVSTNGDIINAATVNRAGSGSYLVAFLSNQASIESGRDTTLNAANDINIVGSKIDATRNLTMTAGNDINVTTDVLHNHSEFHSKKRTEINDTVENIASIITAGGVISASAGNDINVIGSKITANDDINLTAASDVNIASVQDEEMHFSKTSKSNWKGTTIHEKRSYDTTNIESEIHSGGSLNINSGDNTVIVGSTLTTNPGGDITLTAGKQIVIANANETHEKYEHTDHEASMFARTFYSDGWGTTSSKLSFGAKTFDGDQEYEHKSTSANTTNIMSKINAGGDLTTTSAGDTSIIASHLEGDTVSITSTGGKVKLIAGQNTEFESSEDSKKSTSWQSQSSGGYSSSDVVMTEIVARNQLVINALAGVEVDIKNAGSIEESIDILSKQPGLEYLADLKNNPNIDWKKVNAAYNAWDHSGQGLTAVAAVIIAIVVTILTAGSASAIAFATATAATVAGASAGVAYAAAYAATMAAMTSLASTAVISTINNGGDMGEVFDEISSDEYLKQLAISVVTAGATAGAADKLGYATNAGSGAGTATNPSGTLTSADLTWQQHATQITVNSTISAGTKTIINGDGLDDFGDAWIDNAKTGLIMAVGAEATAEFVGKPYHAAADANKGDAPLTADAMQLAGHTVIGCAEGAALSGNCAAGAAGAVAGELGAEWTNNPDAGKIIGAASGVVVGGDAESVNIANLTASNAIENNLLYKNLVADNKGKVVDDNFGPRWRDPKTGKYHSYYKEGFELRDHDHNGGDIESLPGTPIYAAADGKVYRSYNSSSYGNVIIIQSTTSDGKPIWSLSAHMNAPSNLQNGNTVMEGQIIGYIGKTGDSQGNHLHFGVNTGNNSGNFSFSEGWINPVGINIGNYETLQETPAYQNGMSSPDWYNNLGNKDAKK